MTPEQIADLVKRSITEGLSGLPEVVRAATTSAIEPLKVELDAVRARLGVIEQRQAQLPSVPAAPAATLSADGEMNALREELKATRAALSNIAEMPNRRGIHVDGRAPLVTQGPGAGDGFRSIVGECRASKSGTALAAVVERHIKVISEEDGPAPIAGAGSARSLQMILAAGIRAADADGLIGKRSDNWN